MPPDYRWFSSSCGLNLPIFSGDGSVPALDRASLSIVGEEHYDNDNEPHFYPVIPEGVVVDEKEKLEVVNEDDGKVEEGGVDAPIDEVKHEEIE